MSRFFIITFTVLCGVAIFITGIPLAKYLSSQYLELRKELNSQDVLKYSSRENSGPASGKLVSQNENLNAALTHENIKRSEAFELRGSSPDPISRPLQNPVRVKRRSKRRAPQQRTKELLSWTFNLNVTRYSNYSSREKRENASDLPLQKPLEMVFYAQGKAKEQTALDELQNALESIRSFLKNFFASSIEKNANQELEMNKKPLAHFENVSSGTKFDGPVQNVDVVEFGSENNETLPLNQKGREGKFILGLFGFGNRPEKTTQLPVQEVTGLTGEPTQLPGKEVTRLTGEPTQLPGQEATPLTEPTQLTEQEAARLTGEPTQLPGQEATPLTEQPTQLTEQEATRLAEKEPTQLPDQEATVLTEHEKSNAFRKNEELDKNASTLKSEFVTESFQKAGFHSESFSETSLVKFEGMDNMSNVNLQGLTEQNRCSNCATEGFELLDSTNVTAKNAVSETIRTTERVFTDEVLENFCMRLVNKLEESQPEDDFDPELNPPDESNRLRSSQNHSILSLLTLFNSIKEKEATLDSTVLEDSFLVNDASANQRQSDFNILGFGSGRSAPVEEKSNDLTSEEFAGNMDMENLPSILDCENYFKKQSMFTKPNFMDMMTDPKIDLADFSKATISPKLEKHNLQFLTERVKANLNNSVKTFNNNIGDTVKKHKSEEKIISLEKEHFISENENILDENESKFNENKLIDTSTNSGKEFNQTTQSQRDARFFSMFGFGSGNDGSSRSDGDSFLGFEGSGERFLETDIVAQLDRSGELGSGEAFGGNTAFSEGLSTISVEEGRFLGPLGFGAGGSGDGRELSEDIKTVPNEFKSSNESDFMEDCSDEISNTVDEYDYNDCNFESLRANKTGYTDNTAQNECNDCNEIIHDETFVESFLNEEQTNSSRNLTAENRHGTFEDCNCIENLSDENANFSECDKCNLKNLKFPDDSHKVGSNLGTEISEFKNGTKSTQSFGDNCDDCGYGSDVSSTKIIEFDQEKSFFDCDDCNVNVINATDEVNQFKEISEFTNGTKSVHGLACDDCGYESDVPSTKTTDFDQEKSFFDCDDCSTNITNTLDGGYQSEEIAEFTNGTKSVQDHGLACDDCAHESDIHSSETTDFDKLSYLECEECFSNASVEYHENANETFSDRETNSECDDCDSDGIGASEEFFSKPDGGITDTGKNKDSITEPLDENLNSFDRQTTEKIPRFIGPVFLTGSGDGNLFGDNGGPINLVEEESTILSPVFPRRRARLDDIEEDICEDCDVDFSEIFRNDPVEFQQTRTVEDTTRFPKLSKTADGEETGRTISVEILSVNKRNFTAAASTTTELQPRYCASASECNSARNERCITVDFSSICGCDRAYVRHRETNKCVVKRVVETSLKLPAEKFDEDLKNPSSRRYREMEKNALDTPFQQYGDTTYVVRQPYHGNGFERWKKHRCCPLCVCPIRGDDVRSLQLTTNLMWLILRDNPQLLSVIAEVDLAGFREGSLIVDWNLVFAVETESEEKLIKDAEDELKEALTDENLMQKAALDISNASVLAFTSEINPCSSRELNYCSENAYCMVNIATRPRFSCYCKEHYHDSSSNPLYPGEICIDKCPPEYCGPNGHCEIFANNERHCMCTGWYFGRRCEVPGILVLGILAVVASASVIVVIVVACRKRCTTVSYGGPQAFRRSEEVGVHMHTNDRVSDAIALEENIGSKVTKYANISTPVQEVPVIRVTRATLNESSISFDGDSTFATPTVGSNTTPGGNKTELNT